MGSLELMKNVARTRSKYFDLISLIKFINSQDEFIIFNVKDFHPCSLIDDSDEQTNYSRKIMLSKKLHTTNSNKLITSLVANIHFQSGYGFNRKKIIDAFSMEDTSLLERSYFHYYEYLEVCPKINIETPNGILKKNQGYGAKIINSMDDTFDIERIDWKKANMVRRIFPVSSEPVPFPKGESMLPTSVFLEPTIEKIFLEPYEKLRN